jgi:hypothetical protein
MVAGEGGRIEIDADQLAWKVSESRPRVCFCKFRPNGNDEVGVRQGVLCRGAPDA